MLRQESKAIVEEKVMPKELVVLLLFFLVAYVVASGLEYGTFGVPRPTEYFTPEVIESNG
ncbi:hypothetical protein [Allocoleopsis franciscana]|nr:hypothetical protein [Allocoleopsis franciscana]